MRKYIILTIILLITAIFVAVYLFFDPSENHYFPRCPFLVLTGLKCPGCGTQRAIHSILNGEFLVALRYNAMMVCSIPVLLVYGYGELMRKRKPRFYTAICSPAVIWAIFVLVILWWIFRNVFNW